MTLYKLALKNSKAQVQSYFMYVISMAFSVMIYYSFVLIGENELIGLKVEQSLNIKSAFEGSSFIILLFITVFMFSANNFFLKKRKKEIGLYSLLGMKKRQIGYLFFVENILIGLAGLLLGLVSGMILSKLFSMILVAFMHLSMDSNFVFSLEAIKKTSVMFGGVLLFISLRSASTVYRYPLVELFKAKETGGKYKPVTFFTWFFGIVGMGLILYGYYNATHFLAYQEYLENFFRDDLTWVQGALNLLLSCVIGTYLFFHNFLQILLSVLQKIKTYYYRDIHMVTTGNLRFNLRKNATTLATVAVLLGSSLAALGGAVGLQTVLEKQLDILAPMSYGVTEEYADFLEKEINQIKGYKVSDKVDVELKQTIGHINKNDLKDDESYTGTFSILSFSNYKNILQKIKQPNAAILKNEKDVLLLERLMSDSKLELNNIGKEVKLASFSKSFQVADVLEDEIGGNIGGNTGVRYNFPVLVVKDSVYEKIQNEQKYSYRMLDVYPPDHRGELFQQIEKKLPVKRYEMREEGIGLEGDKLVGKVLPEKEISDDEYVYAEHVQSRYSSLARYPLLKGNQIQSGLFIYIAMFLSVVFLLATGSIIALKQLSEAEEEKQRYQLLQKIGVSEDRIRKSIYKQNLFIFAMPLLIALGHAHYALVTLNNILPFPKSGLIHFSQFIMIFFYFVFYILTSNRYVKTVINAQD